MIGQPAIPVQETPQPESILHIGRFVQPEIGAQCRNILCGRHTHPRPLQHDLRRIARRELCEDKREEADAKEYGHSAEKPPTDIALQYVHLHATSASETP